MNEIGLDPGIDHLYAIKTITEVHEKGGKVCYNLIVPFLILNVKVIPRLRSSCPTVAAGPRDFIQSSWAQILLVNPRIHAWDAYLGVLPL